ncbi:GNAT family N-acetyltransferase [Ramlibacter albus]|uniref:GNAT family N-acetyltransferase n=1 Tax=Ramlibacter albus TaxID=2079448 RepID=A0A923M5M6_9BURK|nr:GNAT family N-acetyltransferase [Ramlibacter albus]MBC5764667.1 GNAT family N-acetyltransferase [Ramlibacter albus]
MGAVKAPPLHAPCLITPQHDAAAFTCKHEELSEWLRRRALANQASGSSRTYVVCDAAGAVIGYYALAPGAVANRTAPGSIRRNSPDPVPVFVLGRLAVHSEWAGRGIGSGLLKDALLRAAQAASIVGGHALLCHAIDEDAKAFYLKHGFKASPIEPLTVMLGLKDFPKLL